MITPQVAFVSGAIFAAAFVLSIYRCRQYSSFSAWWNAEGVPLWITAGIIGGALLLNP